MDENIKELIDLVRQIEEKKGMEALEKKELSILFLASLIEESNLKS
jgi:hypothetical protein